MLRRKIKGVGTVVFIIVTFFTSGSSVYAGNIITILPWLAVMIWQKMFKITVNDNTITVRRWIGRKYSFDVSKIVKVDWRTVGTMFGMDEIIKIRTASNHVTIYAVMMGTEDMKTYILENVDGGIINRA